MGLIEHIAFQRPDGNLALILLNGNAENDQTIKIRYGNRKWKIHLPPDSIATGIFKK
jgi:O-glycosyl hydrolase